MRIITSTRPVSHKHIAQRSCVACRLIKAKRDLVRLVRTAEGNIEIDTTGKRPGRGAYLCPVWECWEAVLKGNKLEHSLRSNLNQDHRKQLAEQGKEFIKGVEEG